MRTGLTTGNDHTETGSGISPTLASHASKGRPIAVKPPVLVVEIDRGVQLWAETALDRRRDRTAALDLNECCPGPNLGAGSPRSNIFASLKRLLAQLAKRHLLDPLNGLRDKVGIG